MTTLSAIFLLATCVLEQPYLLAGGEDSSQNGSTAEYAEYAESRNGPLRLPRIPRIPRLSPGLRLRRAGSFGSGYAR